MAHRPARLSSKRGWLSFTRTSSALPVAAAAATVFLAVQGVGGEQHAPHPEFLDQGLGGADLVALIDLLVGQDEGGVAGEGTEHLGGGLVVKMVEAAPQRLAIQGDDPPPWPSGGVTKMLGMTAKSGLDLGRVERVQWGAQRVDGRGATEAGAEGGVEPLAVHADEQADTTVGGGTGQHCQDAEQQQESEAVTLALAAARVGDLVQSSKQAGEWHHGGLRCKGLAFNSSDARLVPRPQTPPSRTAHAQNRTALRSGRLG